jgi:hypothetical protein
VALVPRPEGAHDVLTELPRARLARLRLVENHDSRGKIDVTPAKIGRFAEAHPLAREESVEHAALERDLPTRE